MSNSVQPYGLQPARLLCPWGFSRQEFWSGLPCPPPGDLPEQGIEHASLISPALAGGFFTISTTWEAQIFTCLKANPLASSSRVVMEVPSLLLSFWLTALQQYFPFSLFWLWCCTLSFFFFLPSVPPLLLSFPPWRGFLWVLFFSPFFHFSF